MYSRVRSFPNILCFQDITKFQGKALLVRTLRLECDVFNIQSGAEMFYVQNSEQCPWTFEPVHFVRGHSVPGTHLVLNPSSLWRLYLSITHPQCEWVQHVMVID